MERVRKSEKERQGLGREREREGERLGEKDKLTNSNPVAVMFRSFILLLRKALIFVFILLFLILFYTWIHRISNLFIKPDLIFSLCDPASWTGELTAQRLRWLHWCRYNGCSLSHPRLHHVSGSHCVKSQRNHSTLPEWGDIIWWTWWDQMKTTFRILFWLRLYTKYYIKWCKRFRVA